MTSNILLNEKEIDSLLCPDLNFDIVKRELVIGGRRGLLYFINGFTKEDVYEKMFEYFFAVTNEELLKTDTMETFIRRKVPYTETEYTGDVNVCVTQVLSGLAALLIDGIHGVALIDTRTYPMRGIKEPEKDRSLRGSRDSFIETLVMNTAMMRRRIRDPRLRMEYCQIGSRSKVDVAICYIDGLADKEVVDILRKKLKNIKIKGVSMTQQALAESLVKTSFFNPFPRVKFTERPDYASAVVLEGKIALIMDNSPAVMLLPNSFAEFFKETDDYYFLPLSGTYTRILRITVALLTVYLIPLYLLWYNEPQLLPPFLDFIAVSKQPVIPLFTQFLALEFIIDGLKMASINTPDSLSNSLGIIGGLLLSEFSVEAGWFVIEAILLMAFVAISSYSQPSYEMGYALKFSRMFLLILTQVLGIYGFIGGAVILALVKLRTNTVYGRRYLYPLIPFNMKDLIKVFVRTPINRNH